MRPDGLYRNYMDANFAPRNIRLSHADAERGAVQASSYWRFRLDGNNAQFFGLCGDWIFITAIKSI